ncbi:hypothetical protein NIES2135_21310 [Leptolyngbya boryana NIES-2135]|jgi:hypothetical protein|uniref:Uncharacterized protein n=1 Tax=Leptolyngbya boryana NIES-2135 TaxID=1973484 RepID=A0A1Z4JF60_LEPBY|nr:MULTISPECIES: hypothetical protein [Leptolyngbya]BAY55308.1 hypothetical protein NIES2135_21310 [Leptolyngbya boryana NIES-2135]MBD2369390.1 hypothetical protein [Leptolyngbya sp. FACHB-161]MBD2375608.1 hypothetical protein [Leptolyngbya sp. FACHB-238]MBD2401719.1 hypothetical protein [Leptolyngbya sp. FACHB-239]MBD2406542.1 hypothetical protein [Leptolyngbya sp. FACHB-402]
MKRFRTQYRDELTQWTGPDIEAETWDKAQSIAHSLSVIEQAIQNRALYLQVVAENPPLDMIAIEVTLDSGKSFKIVSEVPTIAAAYLLVATHCSQHGLIPLEMRLLLEHEPIVEPPELW